VRPEPGWCLVRRPDLDDSFRGGAIVIPERILRGWTNFQAVVESVGEPDVCADPDTCLELHTGSGSHIVDDVLVPGAWVLTNCGWYDSPEEDLFFVPTRNIVALLPT